MNKIRPAVARGAYLCPRPHAHTPSRPQLSFPCSSPILLRMHPHHPRVAGLKPRLSWHRRVLYLTAVVLTAVMVGMWTISGRHRTTQDDGAAGLEVAVAAGHIRRDVAVPGSLAIPSQGKKEGDVRPLPTSRTPETTEEVAAVHAIKGEAVEDLTRARVEGRAGDSLPRRKQRRLRFVNDASESDALLALVRRVVGSDDGARGLLPTRLGLRVDSALDLPECARRTIPAGGAVNPPVPANATGWADPADCVHISCSSDFKQLRVVATSGVGGAFAFHQILKRVFNVSVTWGAAYPVGASLAASLDAQFEWPSFICLPPSTSGAAGTSTVADLLLPGRHADVTGVLHQGPSGGLVLRSATSWRYMYNVCTFGYSTPFFGWAEWEREIDFLALHGINLPLAFIGQEAIWYQLWTTKFNATENDVLRHFTGPAFFPWHWMGNLRGWAGPVSRRWVDRRRLLQHQILNRMRSLGMSPVLPGFTGHIPEAVAQGLIAARRGSNHRLSRSSNWMGFVGSNTGVTSMDPGDPEFSHIGEMFVRLLTEEYGPTDYYNADTYNEMLPPSMDSKVLAASASSVLAGIQRAVPTAKWLVQGWLFLHHRHLWGRNEVKAYLDGAGLGNVMVLDLASDIKAMWATHDGFYGHDFIWCMLHSFGGRRGLFGDVGAIYSELHAALASDTPSLVGVGATMEATGHNPVVYEALFDMTFRRWSAFGAAPVAAKGAPDGGGNDNDEMWGVVQRPIPVTDALNQAVVDVLVDNYGTSRYGPTSHHAIRALTLLASRDHKGPYTIRANCCPTWSQATMSPVSAGGDLETSYNPDTVADAAALFLQELLHVTAKKQRKGDTSPAEDDPRFRGLKYDAVDVGRQVLDHVFTEHVGVVIRTVKRLSSGTNGALTSSLVARFTRGIAILRSTFPASDVLLATMPEYRLSTWLSQALDWADDMDPTRPPAEEGRKGDAVSRHAALSLDSVLFNAKNLITSWGDGLGQGYPNYAAKSWSGLFERVYLPRWDVLFNTPDAVKGWRRNVWSMQSKINEGDMSFCRDADIDKAELLLMAEGGQGNMTVWAPRRNSFVATLPQVANVLQRVLGTFALGYSSRLTHRHHESPAGTEGGSNHSSSWSLEVSIPEGDGIAAFRPSRTSPAQRAMLSAETVTNALDRQRSSVSAQNRRRRVTFERAAPGSWRFAPQSKCRDPTVTSAPLHDFASQTWHRSPRVLAMLCSAYNDAPAGPLSGDNVATDGSHGAADGASGSGNRSGHRRPEAGIPANATSSGAPSLLCYGFSVELPGLIFCELEAVPQPNVTRRRRDDDHAGRALTEGEHHAAGISVPRTGGSFTFGGGPGQEGAMLDAWILQQR